MAVALAFAAAIGLILSPAVLRWPVAVVLIALGVSRLLRHRHPRWAAMRVGIGGLTLWSFLMASAHGAGLMVVPVVVGITATSDSAHHHHHHAAAMATPAGALAATSIHALGYLLVTAILAVIVFEKLGVGVAAQGVGESRSHLGGCAGRDWRCLARAVTWQRTAAGRAFGCRRRYGRAKLSCRLPERRYDLRALVAQQLSEQ